jgi:hypothetical protein
VAGRPPAPALCSVPRMVGAIGSVLDDDADVELVIETVTA